MRLPPLLSEWLNLLARWFHVFAAIMWVGSTYYFTWLDGRFQEEEREARGEGGDPEVWVAASTSSASAKRRASAASTGSAGRRPRRG